MTNSPQSFDDWLVERLSAHGVHLAARLGYSRAIIAALKSFQAKAGLPVTGKADVSTVTALRRDDNDAAPAQMEPAWLVEARRLLGVQEIAGPKSSSTIIGWAKSLGGWVARYFTGDDIPWCGLFVAHVLASALPEELLPANPLSARAWATFGRALGSPSPGAVLVFSRTGGGHVGLYVGETAKAYRVLGGNQSNRVSLTWIAKDRLLSMRWPLTGTAPNGQPVPLQADGSPLSTNEA